MTNKSPVFFCIKVLYAGCDVKFEVPRPSYIAVPPGGTVHALFDDDGGGGDDGDNDDDKSALQIMILFDNPKEEKAVKKKKDKPIVYETKRHVDTDKISSCAKVSMFRSVVVYTVSTKERNVVLKYKGKGLLEPRKGNKLSETGLIGALLGKKLSSGIDLSTNVTSLSSAFRLSV